MSSGKSSVIAGLLIALSGYASASPVGQPEAYTGIAAAVLVFIPFMLSTVFVMFREYLEDWMGLLGSFISFVAFLLSLYLANNPGAVSFTWIPSMGIDLSFLVDQLSAGMSALITGVGTLVFLYSDRYMENEPDSWRFYSVLIAFMGSMLGLVLSSNLIVLFLFWEGTSICSYLLISHYRDEAGFRAARKSLLITAGSGIIMLAGFVMLGEAAATFSLVDMLSSPGTTLQAVQESGLLPAVSLSLLTGIAAKSAQFPFHIWLPDAMEAPTPVSAFLHSATMVKAGVYLLGRLTPIFSGTEVWSTLVLPMGLLTMMLGALLAFLSDDIKRLLAYSTISHLGLIVAGFGFGDSLGVETATVHILNHGIFKASLFMIAGIIAHEAGSRSIRELSGLRKSMPLTAVVATLSGLSMAGLPLLGGFFSKELLYESSIHAFSHGSTIFIPIISFLASVFTLLYSLKFLSIFYLGEDSGAHGEPFKLLLPPALLAGITLFFGLFPGFLSALAGFMAQTIADLHGIELHYGVNKAFLLGIATYITGAILFRSKNLLYRVSEPLMSHSVLKEDIWYRKLLEVGWIEERTALSFFDRHFLHTWVAWLLIPVISWVLLTQRFLPDLAGSLGYAGLFIFITALGGSLGVLRARKHISTALTLSILGFMTAIYYLLANAPDLTMTQLMVETLTLLIFLTVLKELPELPSSTHQRKRLRDILIAFCSGLMVFFSMSGATRFPTPDRLSSFFTDHALPGSGGENIVNVILVDFRGLDTLGEISVIAMAGLAVVMLFRRRDRL